MALKRESPPVAAGGARESDCLGAVSSEIIPQKQQPQVLLPSRAALAWRWPNLRLNRLTGRWVDDASGASGARVAAIHAQAPPHGEARS